MRKTHVTVKHAVAHVITNLNLLSEENDAHSEPAREIQHILVLSRSYIHKIVAFDYQGDLKRWFEEKYI